MISQKHHSKWANSSAVEHLLCMQGVWGSNPHWSTNRNLIILLLSISLILLARQGVLASHSESISIQSTDESINFSIQNANQAGGVSLALADLGDDGVSEIIIGNGMGFEPRVRVFRQDGSEIGNFLVYAQTLGVGINVVACDVTGDGYNEIIVSPQRGGGPHIRVFDRFGNAIDQGGFFAYEATMREGVNLACGDLTGDTRAEFVTLPAAGGGPHVRVWSWNENAELVSNFFAYHTSDRSGVVGVVYEKKLYLAQQHTSYPILKTIVIHSQIQTLHEEQLSIDGLGVESMSVFDAQIYLSTASSSTLYNVTAKKNSLLPSDHSVLATDGDILLTSPGRLLFSPEIDTQHIEIDSSEQRLYAFENGILRNIFLISSGLYNSTPIGSHLILAKVPLVHYTWNYGEGDPRNYDLGRVSYNLRFYPHIYIHYAPWHNNFGHQMSHGCVNVGLPNMQWLYAWAQEGTTVVVKE